MDENSTKKLATLIDLELAHEDTANSELSTEQQRKEEESHHLSSKIGNFILAKLPSTLGKKTLQYVCMIEDIMDDKVVVLVFKSKSKTDFLAIENDISFIEENDIIMFLPQPKLRGKNYCIFPTEIFVKEI